MLKRSKGGVTYRVAKHGLKGPTEVDTAMKEKTTGGKSSSRVACESLENWARLENQDWLQELMVSEFTELLVREKSKQRKGVDAKAGYRNGYGKPRRLTMSVGTVTFRRPRTCSTGTGTEW